MTDSVPDSAPGRALRPAVPQPPRPPVYAKRPAKRMRRPNGKPKTRVGQGTHLARAGLIGIIKTKD